MGGNKNADNQKRKSRMQDRAEMEQMAKASAKRHSHRSSDRSSGGGRSSKSPRRRTSSEDLDGIDSSIKKPRSSRSSKGHSSFGASSSSRHRSKSRDSVDDESSSLLFGAEDPASKSSRSSGGRKERMKSRAESERAIKAASKRPPFDPRGGIAAQMDDLWEEDVRDPKQSMTSLSLADSDAQLKKRRSSRSRGRSTESTGSLKKPSRRHSSDDKAALKSARSRSSRSPIKPGVEKVRHRHRSSSRDNDRLASSHRSASSDRLASSHRSANSRMLSPDEHEVQLHATSVDDTQDDPRIQMIEQRNDDLEQRLNQVIERTDKGEAPSKKEPPAKKAGFGRLTVLVLFFFGIGVGAAIGYFLRGGCVPCKPCETAAPTIPPTSQATGAPSTPAPTIDFVYDPPSDEDCLRIQNSLPVNGQSELAVKTFDIIVDTSLTSESFEATNWPEVLARAMAAFLIPDLVGCPVSGDDESASVASAQTVSDGSNNRSIRRKLRNIRYVIANAIAFGERRSYYSCEDSAPTPCYKAAVTLTLLLKGDEPNVSLFTLISDVILAYDRGAPLVDKFGLANSGFAFVNIVGMEEVPYEPSSDAACDAIANQLPVPGQESMTSKSFDVAFDVALANSGVSDWLPQLTQGIQENMIPEMACCTNSGSESGNGRTLRELDIGRNLRCGVGNAIPTTATEVPEVSCQPGMGGTCVHSVVNLQVYLKGDELNTDIANLISNVILGNSGGSIVDRYGFSRNVFSEINLVIVESRDPTTAPTFLPTPSPSVKMVETSIPSNKPTSAPVVGPTTKYPTRVPTISPTKVPTGRPVDEPTPPPTPGPTQPPTPVPTPRPTLAPAPGPVIAASETPTLVPSETPSETPSQEPSAAPSSTPSFSPSWQPSPVPSSAPSPEPSSVPSLAPTSRRSYLVTLLEPAHGPLTNPSFDWLADVDDWNPPSESPNRDALFTERYAMAKIGDSLNGLSGWKGGNAACSWSGVTCAGEQVTVLDLENQGLTGSLPTEIGILTNLQNVKLGNSDIGGTIPLSLASLTNLVHFSLSHNNLNGKFPPQLSSLTNLENLNFEHNSLTGTIPPSIGALTKLTRLDFDFNGMDGTVPTELGRLTKLAHLDLCCQGFSGTIPTELGLLRDLRMLDMAATGIWGTIPTEFNGLSITSWFSFDWCGGLTGPLPSITASSGYCKLNGNCFTGSIAGCDMDNSGCP